MWIQAKWGTLKDELWKQCMALTRMDCWTFSQQEKQMYLMFIFNSSDNWACCVQENMAAIVWTAFCEIVLFTPVKQLQKMRPILQHLLPYHCTLKKKKNQQQQKVCYEGMLGLQVIVDDSQNRAWRRTKSIVWRKKQSKTKPPPFLCRITRLPSLARTPRNLVQLPC